MVVSDLVTLFQLAESVLPTGANLEIIEQEVGFASGPVAEGSKQFVLSQLRKCLEMGRPRLVRPLKKPVNCSCSPTS